MPVPRGRRVIIAATLLVAALVLVACSGVDGDRGGGNGGGSPGAEASGRVPPADCDPARPATATDDPQTFSFGGEERAYLRRSPASGGQAYPATDTILDSFDGHARAGDTGDDAT